MTDKLREEFENGYLGGNKHAARRNEHGDYVLPSVQDAWAGYKAATETLVKKLAEKEVMLDKAWLIADCEDATDETLLAIQDAVKNVPDAFIKCLQEAEQRGAVKALRDAGDNAPDDATENYLRIRVAELGEKKHG